VSSSSSCIYTLLARANPSPTQSHAYQELLLLARSLSSPHPPQRQGPSARNGVLNTLVVTAIPFWPTTLTSASINIPELDFISFVSSHNHASFTNTPAIPIPVPYSKLVLLIHITCEPVCTYHTHTRHCDLLLSPLQLREHSDDLSCSCTA
jgi:hypothetical protein